MSKYKVPYLDLGAQYQIQKDEILAEIDRVLANAQFILRKDVDTFEERMGQFYALLMLSVSTVVLTRFCLGLRRAHLSGATKF